MGFLFQELAEPASPHECFFPRGLAPDLRYRFYSLEQKVDITRFGSLVNTVAPIHVRQGSLLYRLIDRFVQQPGETEDYTASGAVLMAGVKLKPAFAGTGYNAEVRFWGDFSSRLYLMEAVDD